MRAAGVGFALALLFCGCGRPGEGAACGSPNDCASGLSCEYPIAEGCSARGVCLDIQPAPGTATCDSVVVVCGCQHQPVFIHCGEPSGYASSPVANLYACR
jgi:hypothetical protein